MPQFQVKNNLISQVDNFKYLGVIYMSRGLSKQNVCRQTEATSSDVN